MSYYRFLLASALVPAALFAFPSSLEAAALSHGHASTADCTHTHTSTLSAEPASRFIDMAHSYKTAAVCFLGYGDCGDAGFGSMGGDDGYQIDSAQQCQNEGFVNSCASGYCLDKSCPYNAAYGKCRAENCHSGSATSCNGEVVGQTACGNSCKKCCDDSCPSGYSKSTTSECYDTSKTECGTVCYKAKDCDTCSGYYDCGGSWQYCEGTTCPEDSSKCSVYCDSDYFSYSCASASVCSSNGGIYRNGYCSKSCGTSGSSEPSVSECEDPGCDVNAYCSGSYCYCNAGYTGSGTSCSPDLCYGVTCPKANMECINLFDGYCKCRSGWGNNSSGECQENYGSEWLCCTKEERAWDGDNASECLASGSFGEADSFYSQCEAQGGTPSRSGSYSHGGRYNVCAYTCTFSAEHFPI